MQSKDYLRLLCCAVIVVAVAHAAAANYTPVKGTREINIDRASCACCHQ